MTAPMRPTEAGEVLKQPMLAARHIGKAFGAHVVLTDVSLDVERGEVVCIIGPSGSGKSTFLRCINFLEVPDAGGVWVDGERIGCQEVDGVLWEVPSAVLARQRAAMGMVFQRFNLFGHLMAVDNVALALRLVKRMPRPKARERALAVLASVGMERFAGHRPAQLSGGQQQRVAIARAVAMDPKVLLFDEPTSALDPELVGEVLKVIGDLAREGRTMVLVTHEMKFAREVASHVIYLHNGRVEEEGPPEQVFGAPKSERLKQFIRSVT